jgi:hypothetical protein
VLASPLRLTTENKLSSLVCFSRPSEEDNASFSVVLEAMKANRVEELEQESALQKEGD